MQVTRRKRTKGCIITLFVFIILFAIIAAIIAFVSTIKMIAQLLGDTEKMVLEVYNHIVDQKENAAGAVNAAVI